MTIFLIFAVCCLIMSVLLADSCLAVEWTRAGINTEEPRWGIKGELEIGLWSQGDRQGPRGLIRLYYPIGAAEGGSTRVNFIAVEPVVKGRKGYSELEESAHDGKPGKRFWALDELLTADSPPLDALGLKPGVLSTSASGVEQLAITIRVEPFRNGAHPYIIATFRADRPNEVSFAVYGEDDSADMEYCILTATMGNFARLRRIWLRDRVVDSKKLYADYDDIHFAPETCFPLEALPRTESGDIIVRASTDETDPASVSPFGNRFLWRWPGGVYTQYWKKTVGSYRPDLRVRVNARKVYWAGTQPIPGGISFENFELQEKFYSGQEFIYGITQGTQ